MKNFLFSIPTKVYFGKGQIGNLIPSIKEYGNKVLLVFGGGSIKKIGLYDMIINLFKENGIEWIELSGVEPNPRITSVNAGVKLCREFGADMLLSVGGGSSIDCAKAIAASVDYDGDAWDIVSGQVPVNNALPIIVVLTLSATGSELNGNSVISNLEKNDKIGLHSPKILPKCSILDPTYTYSVSKYHTAAGTADIMSHILEAYFNLEETVYLQDSIAESLLKTCIKYGRIAFDEPDNYEARANLMWASSLALCGLTSYGKTPSYFSVHDMEHQLSAYYDITHGIGLAILTTRWMKHILSTNLDKFVEYGVNVWGISETLDKNEIASLAIEKTSEFFKELEIPSTLPEVGIKDEKYFNIMAEKGASSILDKEAVLSIFKACM